MLVSIPEMAKMCGTDYDHIASIIAKENIKLSWNKPYRLDEDQQLVILMVLHYENRYEFVTLPSKMNDPNFDTTEVYSKEIAIKRYHLTPSNGINL